MKLSNLNPIRLFFPKNDFNRATALGFLENVLRSANHSIIKKERIGLINFNDKDTTKGLETAQDDLERNRGELESYIGFLKKLPDIHLIVEARELESKRTERNLAIILSGFFVCLAIFSSFANPSNSTIQTALSLSTLVAGISTAFPALFSKNLQKSRMDFYNHIKTEYKKKKLADYILNRHGIETLQDLSDIGAIDNNGFLVQTTRGNFEVKPTKPTQRPRKDI